MGCVCGSEWGCVWDVGGNECGGVSEDMCGGVSGGVRGCEWDVCVGVEVCGDVCGM